MHIYARRDDSRFSILLQTWFCDIQTAHGSVFLSFERHCWILGSEQNLYFQVEIVKKLTSEKIMNFL